MPHDGMYGAVLLCMLREKTHMHSADAHACLYCSSARFYMRLCLNDDTFLSSTPACANSMHKNALACIRLIGPQAQVCMH